jgi:lipopolysaccharide export system protein LptC
VDRKTVASLLALLVAAVASGVLLFRSDESEAPASRTPRLGIGYYVNDATLTGTDDDGHILYRVKALTVQQTPVDGSVNLQSVTVDYDPAKDVPWNLRADTGRIPPGGKMIELSGNVVAATREADSPAATIRTDFLEFDPGTNVASTDRKVVIEYAGSTVHATGLRAMLRQDRLELLSDVTGQYIR